MAYPVQKALTDDQIDRALAQGRLADLREPRAIQARYDRRRQMIVVELSNGCSFTFPPHLGQGLENATDDELADITILGTGYGLQWEALDLDLSVPGLLAGIFGTRSHMARLAGGVSTPAKARAARMNGAKGGRPRRVSST
jgi:hypothetical protein